MAELRFYRRAEQAASQILDAFRSGDLPKRLALVFVHRKDDVPCRKWSWSNQLIVALTGHSDARGYRQWQAVGRHVKKGKKAFYILSPCIKRYKKTDDETGEEDERTFLLGFTSTAVFGYSQTDGAPLPDADPEVTNWLDNLPLVEVAKSWGLTVDAYNGKRARYLGYYRHGESIALGVRNLAVWAHELVHAADDRVGTLTQRSGQQPDNEIVAQLGATTLLELLGCDIEADRGFAWDYIQGYAAKAKVEPVVACQRLLKRSCGAVALILDTAEQLRSEGEHEPTGHPAPTPPKSEPAKRNAGGTMVWSCPNSTTSGRRVIEK